MKSFYKGLQSDILILGFLHLLTQVKIFDEHWCNLAGKGAGKGRQNRPCVFNLPRSQVMNKGNFEFGVSLTVYRR